MNYKKVGLREYLKFCDFEGSQHIASEFALVKLLTIVDKFQVKSILEIGLGIGSIASTLLSNFREKDLCYVGTEANEFCLENLQKNLNTIDYKNLHIVHSLNESLDFNKTYDLVIVDGLYDDIVKLKGHVNKHALIAIEGDRKTQELEIKKVFPKAIFVSMLSYKKNHPKGVGIQGHWQGGMKLFFLRPTFGQYIFWLKEKIKTKIGYFYRKYRSK